MGAYGLKTLERENDEKNFKHVQASGKNVNWESNPSYLYGGGSGKKF